MDSIDDGLCLWRGVGFRLNCVAFRLVMCVIDCHGKWDWHHAKGFGLEKLHCRSDVFFHQLRYLPFCAIRWTLFPHLLLAPTVTCLPLMTIEWARLSHTSHLTGVHMHEKRPIKIYMHIAIDNIMWLQTKNRTTMMHNMPSWMCS